MQESVRIKRLRSDQRAMAKLREESSIIEFAAEGDPAYQYRVIFWGAGLYRPEGSEQVVRAERHEVLIHLNAAYPRMIPDLSWQSPIFHPNISASGIVCLGGYSTHWAPSLTLDELCVMLWDMIRYHNFDVESPYNREAAIWARDHVDAFPVDSRPLRDRLSQQLTHRSRQATHCSQQGAPGSHQGAPVASSQVVPAEIVERRRQAEPIPDVQFIEPEVVEPMEAEIVNEPPPEIFFIDD